MTAIEETLNEDQQQALGQLRSPHNIFLTGAAGSGKSYLLRAYLKDSNIPILASTGAAAILIGGRTFHSFFGLGIMEGGLEATVQRALQNKRLLRRIKKTSSVVIDEVSMISGSTFRAAEIICREARAQDLPWGGLRVIVVGDFAQLPPVNPYSRQKEWAFLDSAWLQSQFQPVVLTKPMRTADPLFLQILNSVRLGQATSLVREFLDSRMEKPTDAEFTRLFPHRQSVENFNLDRLNEIAQPLHVFETVYSGIERDIENFKKHSPIADQLLLKVDALVMLRQNDPQGRYVNGSLGHIKKIKPDELQIELLNGRTIALEKTSFSLLDAEGRPVVSACNFPLSLAWAMTIHKAQGATLDRVMMDLERVWEPGQAYVALSRARSAEGLFVERWSSQSILADPQVQKFHAQLMQTRSSSSSPADFVTA